MGFEDVFPAFLLNKVARVVRYSFSFPIRLAFPTSFLSLIGQAKDDEG